jgi:hypothetical protein
VERFKWIFGVQFQLAQAVEQIGIAFEVVAPTRGHHAGHRNVLAEVDHLPDGARRSRREIEREGSRIIARNRNPTAVKQVMRDRVAGEKAMGFRGG